MSNGRVHMRWDTRIFWCASFFLEWEARVKKFAYLWLFPPSSASADHVWIVVYGCHEKVPWRKKNSPHHSRKKSRIFTLLLFLLRRRFEVKPRAEAQPAPPGFSFSGDLWQNFWSIHPYARPPFSPYMPTELWQKPNISYKGIEFLMPPLGWLVAGDF